MSLWNDKTDVNAYPDSPQEPDLLNLDVCLSSKGLREFLNLSRHNTDDVIKQRLNSRLNDRNYSKSEVCKDFIDTIVIKNWTTRLKVIKFCSYQSELLESQLKREEEPNSTGLGEVDLRVDPYAIKDLESIKEEKYRQLSSLKNWVANEREIERIVQNRSLEVLQDTCGTEVLKLLKK
ncbi:hypothetical protein WICMUC_000711 [Wickerhamomyces mucosus]|uniref:Uncharacterized protein n=1 Tax=Wickerhamomyces mucosus TaxID=1378264 RepID=A0A9P8THP1_9ASCO|nr:hypothetical protein WICMUC_000711 [Wickerhamomyces mucosus]